MRFQPLVSIFDFWKKKNMEKHYQQSQVWGREDSNPDIEAGMKLLRDRTYHRCLDVGTALGHYAEALSPLCDSILAIDLSKKAVDRGRKRLAHLSNIEFEATNIRDLQSHEPFDLIVLADVLYYLGDEKFPKAFKEVIHDIATRVAPGGRIFITTFITRGRTKEQARSYGTLFESHTFRLERSEVFSHGHKEWVMQLLVRS